MKGNPIGTGSIQKSKEIKDSLRYFQILKISRFVSHAFSPISPFTAATASLSLSSMSSERALAESRMQTFPEAITQTGSFPFIPKSSIATLFFRFDVSISHKQAHCHGLEAIVSDLSLKWKSIREFVEVSGVSKLT